MFEWLSQNIGTIIVCVALAGVITLIVLRGVKNRKKGSVCSCKGGCCGCPYSEGCAIGDDCREKSN